MPSSGIDTAARDSILSLKFPNVTSTTFCTSVRSDAISIDFFIPLIAAYMPPTAPNADNILLLKLFIFPTLLLIALSNLFSVAGIPENFPDIFFTEFPREVAALPPLEPVLAKLASAFVMSIRFWLTFGAFWSCAIMEFNADASCGMLVTAFPAALVPSRDIERASSDIFATSSLTLMFPSD